MSTTLDAMAPAFGLGPAAGSRLQAQVRRDGSPYRSSEYLRRLNDVLRSELDALASYQASILPTHKETLDRFRSWHHDAGRSIERLIRTHHGLPEGRTTVLGTMTSRLVGWAQSTMPRRVGTLTTLRVLDRIENSLYEKYSRALQVAPGRDIQTLTALLECTRDHHDILSRMQRDRSMQE